MFLADGWIDYTLLNAGGGEKLERWGDYTLLRPDPLAVWPFIGKSNADAHYIRSESGGGHWVYNNPLPESWVINYGKLRFIVRPTGFKHTGIFPEQSANWDWMAKKAEQRQGVRVLNLFAYTGGASCALALAGAMVTHVDAAKGMVNWAKENMALCGLKDKPVRFLVDDALKFVKREKRRGNYYDGIIMDPPSYGRGPDGELWKIEKHLYNLIEETISLLSDKPLFVVVNSYTTGLAPAVISGILKIALRDKNPQIVSEEIGLPIKADEKSIPNGLVLPCGATGRAWW